MFHPASPTFSLHNFEGPLELLIHLIQKNEIDINSIILKRLTEQFLVALEHTLAVDAGCETLYLAATLLWLKSRKLLPLPPAVEEENLDIERLEAVETLLEYCRFRDAALLLAQREDEQKCLVPRAIAPYQKEPGRGLEEITIDTLKQLLTDLIQKTVPPSPHLIYQEEWPVSDKLAELQHLLEENPSISFDSLFSPTKSRYEKIVFFIALLELMKQQEVKVVREKENLYIIPYDTRTYTT